MLWTGLEVDGNLLFGGGHSAEKPKITRPNGVHSMKVLGLLGMKISNFTWKPEIKLTLCDHLFGVS